MHKRGSTDKQMQQEPEQHKTRRRSQRFDQEQLSITSNTVWPLLPFLYTVTDLFTTTYICNGLACLLEMCSVSTNGERASPAQQGFQLIGCHFSYTLDKNANIQVQSLPEHQELVHISVHKCITKLSILSICNKYDVNYIYRVCKLKTFLDDR